MDLFFRKPSHGSPVTALIRAATVRERFLKRHQLLDHLVFRARLGVMGSGATIRMGSAEGGSQLVEARHIVRRRGTLFGDLWVASWRPRELPGVSGETMNKTQGKRDLEKLVPADEILPEYDFRKSQRNPKPQGTPREAQWSFWNRMSPRRSQPRNRRVKHCKHRRRLFRSIAGFPVLAGVPDLVAQLVHGLFTYHRLGRLCGNSEQPGTTVLRPS